MKIALLGNPNAGKTSFFNTVCQKKEKVSNYAGTTLKMKESSIEFEAKKFHFFDLPGIYSLDKTCEEEEVTLDFLKNNHIDHIINIIDTDNIKRSLLLTLEIAQLGVPITIVFVQKSKKHDFNTYIEIINKTFPFLAFEYQMNEKESLIPIFKNVCKEQHTNEYDDYIIKNLYKSTAKEILAVQKSKKLNLLEATQEIISENETQSNTIEFKKLQFLKNLFGELFHEKKSYLSEKIDRFLLNSYISIPLFLVVMYGVFELTFNVGGIFADYTDAFFTNTINYMSNTFGNGIISTILIEGVFGGIGALFVFLPNIIIMFMALNILEQTGYLARVAFILDKHLKKLGINGKASPALLMGFGCNVPGLMMLKSLGTKKERIITGMMIPFMSCNARLPVFILIISAFFPEKYHSLTLFSIYIIGVIVSIITGAGLNKLMKGQRTPILLELPRYQYPRIKEILLYGWKPTKSFLVKAGKIVIPISIVLWVLFSFPRIDGESVPAEDTYAASVGKTIGVIFEPLGYDWKLSTGLVAGFGAKEIMVSTLGTIYAIEEDNEDGLIETFRSDPNMNIGVALSLIIFVLLYAPCMTVFGVMKEQIGWKWALISITYSTVLGWILAFIIYQSYLIIV